MDSQALCYILLAVFVFGAQLFRSRQIISKRLGMAANPVEILGIIGLSWNFDPPNHPYQFLGCMVLSAMFGASALLLFSSRNNLNALQ